jgi:hypothetical protein
MDAAYEDAATAVIDKPGIGTPAAKATASMVADNGLLYIYVDVTDPDVVIPSEEVQANEPWYADSVEFLLHPRNEIFTDIHQFRVDVTGYLSYYRNSNGDIQAYGDAAEKYFVGHAAVRTGVFVRSGFARSGDFVYIGARGAAHCHVGRQNERLFHRNETFRESRRRGEPCGESRQPPDFLAS